MRGIASANPFWLSALVNAILFSTTYLVYTPKFQHNDDPMMMLLAAGVGRGLEPSVYLNFSHVVVGWILTQLYQISIDFPWYALYLISALFAAHGVILHLLLRGARSFVAFALYLTYFFLVGTNLLINLQFTIASVLLGVAGVLALLSVASSSQVRDAREEEAGLCSHAAMGLLLIVAASMIRVAGMNLALALTAPMWILCLKPGNGRRFGVAASLAVLALGLSLGLERVNTAVYDADVDARGFAGWNSSAVQFLDYDAETRVDKTTWNRVLLDVGWSDNDFEMFKQWFYMNDGLYSQENFERMLSELPAINRALAPKDAVRQLVGIFDDPFVKNCCLLFVLISMFIRFDRHSAAVLTLTVAMLIVLSLYLVYTTRPPPARVYFPMFAYGAFASLFVISSGRFRSFASLPRFRQVAIVALLIPVLILAARTLEVNGEQDRYNRRVDRLHRQFVGELDLQPGQIYWSWTGAFGWHFISPFGGLSYLKGLVAPDTRLFPSTRKILRHAQIDDAYMDLATNDDAFLAVYAGQVNEKLPLLRQYMIEHYGRGIRWSRVAANPAFEVYKILLSDEPAAR